jgi:ADP-ribose pyrophosphatase YjhB (NUDIX family)
MTAMTALSAFPAGFRPAARALLLDHDDRVLLVRFEFPGRTVWATPGGGIEPGEDVEQALRRELVEEVGLHDPDIGPHLWTRTIRAREPIGPWIGQSEVVHLVRVAPFEPAPALSWEQLRQEFVHEIRWWSLPELDALDAPVATAPRRLVELVRDLLVQGPPAVPHVLDR